MGNYYDAINEMVNRLTDKLLIYDCKGFKAGKRGKTLSLLDTQILRKIANNEERKIYELMGETGLERSTITSSVRKLILYGYIQKEQCEKDRRVYILKATDLGKEFMDLRRKEQREWLEHVLEDMSLNEKKVILKFLNNINKK